MPQPAPSRHRDSVDHLLVSLGDRLRLVAAVDDEGSIAIGDLVARIPDHTAPISAIMMLVDAGILVLDWRGRLRRCPAGLATEPAAALSAAKRFKLFPNRPFHPLATASHAHGAARRECTSVTVIMTTPINRSIVKRPCATSSFRVFHAPGFDARALACDWPDLDDLRAHLRAQACAGAYVLSGLDAQRPVGYVGEGSRLWDRLADHRNLPPLPLVQTIHLVCSPSDYDKAAALFFQAVLSDRLRDCGRVERIGAEPARLSLPRDQLDELQRQVEPVLALLAMAGCSAVVPARPNGTIGEGDLA